MAPSLVHHLQDLTEGFAKPIYFVLGNHDYYRGSFHQMDEELCALEHPQLIWLRQAADLEAEWALVGNGGWYDGRYGDAAGTPVEMSEFIVLCGHTHSPGEYERRPQPARLHGSGPVRSAGPRGSGPRGERRRAHTALITGSQLHKATSLPPKGGDGGGSPEMHRDRCEPSHGGQLVGTVFLKCTVRPNSGNRMCA